MKKHNSRKKHVAKKKYNSRKYLNKVPKEKELKFIFRKNTNEADSLIDEEKLSKKHNIVWYVRKIIVWILLIIGLIIEFYCITHFPMERDPFPVDGNVFVKKR